MSKAQEIRDALADGELQIRVLAEQVGLQVPDCGARISQLVKLGHVVRPQRGFVRLATEEERAEAKERRKTAAPVRKTYEIITNYKDGTILRDREGNLFFSVPFDDRV